MKLFFIVVVLFILSSCTTVKQPNNINLQSFKDDINYSIVHDFHNNDTIGKNIYVIK